jgi:inorganic pyrophosphatase/exopolyphosphatase
MERIQVLKAQVDLLNNRLPIFLERRRIRMKPVEELIRYDLKYYEILKERDEITKEENEILKKRLELFKEENDLLKRRLQLFIEKNN